MTQRTFEVGEFSVTYTVRKWHPDNGAPHDDWAEVGSVRIARDEFGTSSQIEVMRAVESIPQFIDFLGEEANKHLKEHAQE